MRSFLVFSHTGPMLILSKYDSIQQPELFNKLSAYGKFVAHEISVEAVRSCYSAHFEHLLSDPKESEEMIVLDSDGERIFTNISFQTLGPPSYFEPGQDLRCYP